MTAEKGHICIFVGSETSFNVINYIQNASEILSPEFKLDLVTTRVKELPLSITEDLNVYSSIDGTSYYDELSAIREYCSSHTPDLVLMIVHPWTHGSMIALNTLNSSTKFAYRYSGDVFNKYKLTSSLKKRAKQYLLNNIIGRFPFYMADEYIALGPYGERQLTSAGASPDNVHVLPPPIDATRFETMTECPEEISDDNHTVLYVGRIVEQKGKETLETVITDISAKSSDFQFVIVGEERDALEIPNKYRDNVSMVGTVPPNDIIAYFQHSDILVHPSLSEGFGRVLVEALFCDTPVIARDATEMPMITDNLFTTDDELVNMILDYESLSIDPSSHFTVEYNRDEYIDIFSDLCSD
jgi:glycosyltransferase involved in cell wall biosynthesis